MDLLDLFDRGSAWTASKMPAAATQLSAPTGCEGWDVRTLIDHMISTQRYFAGSARGEETPLPGPTPPAAIGDDPVGVYATTRAEMISAFSEPGVIEKTGASLGIAFSDQLIHGWDLATATGQDVTMPEDLASAAFSMIDGRLTDEFRNQAGFKPAIDVPASAPAQAKLLAYTGRQP
jgi:uncharacterized protein (TIGR03086 family)